MGTELLSSVTVEQAVVVVFDTNDGAKLAQSLSNKGFGRISLAHHPRHTRRVARDASVHVVLVALARGDDDEAQLVRGLGEGPEPPRLIVIAEFESVRRELEGRLGDVRKPDRVLVKPVPTAKLVHEIELQLRQRSVEGRPADDAPLFAEVLAQVWQEQRTGVLRVISGGMQTVIYLRDGKPLFAEGGTPADMLGRILVETGRITDKQLSEAVELMTDRLVDNEQLQLGGALVELGFLNASELFETLSEQVRRKLLTCFSWRKVRVEFREGAEHLTGITELDNAVPALLLAGVAQTPAEEVQRFLERVRAGFPAAAVPVREIERAFGLGGKERRLLDLADGKRSVRELLTDAPTDPLRTGQLLMALILGRALRLGARPGAAAEPPKSAKVQGSSSIYGSARLVPGEDLDEEEEERWNRVRSLFKGAIKRGD